jgi:hypothetical protein
MLLDFFPSEPFTPYGNLSVSTPASSHYHRLIGPFVGTYDLWMRFHAGDTDGAFELMKNE